jgi:hypothetical protein
MQETPEGEKHGASIVAASGKGYSFNNMHEYDNRKEQIRSDN